MDQPNDQTISIKLNGVSYRVGRFAKPIPIFDDATCPNGSAPDSLVSRPEGFVTVAQNNELIHLKDEVIAAEPKSDWAKVITDGRARNRKIAKIKLVAKIARLEGELAVARAELETVEM